MTLFPYTTLFRSVQHKQEFHGKCFHFFPIHIKEKCILEFSCELTQNWPFCLLIRNRSCLIVLFQKTWLKKVLLLLFAILTRGYHRRTPFLLMSMISVCAWTDGINSWRWKKSWRLDTSCWWSSTLVIMESIYLFHMCQMSHLMSRFRSLFLSVNL